MPASQSLTDDPSRYALRSAQLGAVLWLLLLAWQLPSLFSPTWAQMMLLLAALVHVPLALRLIEPDGTWVTLRATWRLAVLWQMPAAILLVPACLLEPNWSAVIVTFPWLLTTMLIALVGALRVRLEGWRSWQETAISAGLIYVAIGGVWLLLDRLGARPLHFDPIIVTLTAIHFHYAGFLLPIFAGLVGKELRNRLATLAACGVVCGVPLVALGITTTQLGFAPLIEAFAVWLTSLAGLLVAMLHVRLACESHLSAGTRVCFAFCGIALAGSMILSAMYGARFYWHLEWLDLPWMRALHGTANALGFGLVGVFGWSLKSRTAI